MKDEIGRAVEWKLNTIKQADSKSGSKSQSTQSLNPPTV